MNSSLEGLAAGEEVEHLEDVLPEELDLLGVDGGRALQQQRRLREVHPRRRAAVQRDVQLRQLLDVVLQVPGPISGSITESSKNLGCKLAMPCVSWFNYGERERELFSSLKSPNQD